MKAHTLIAAAALAVMATSCQAYRYSEARIADGRVDVAVVTPSVKVDVEEKIVQDTWIFEGDELKVYQNKKATPDALRDVLKVAATHKTLIKRNGDVLMTPLYEVHSELDGKRYVVEVRGYIGRFTEWDKDGVTTEEAQTLPANMKIEKVIYTR